MDFCPPTNSIWGSNETWQAIGQTVCRHCLGNCTCIVAMNAAIPSASAEELQTQPGAVVFRQALPYDAVVKKIRQVIEARGQ
jgi:hypothetical protein